jgi:hypothetical protein
VAIEDTLRLKVELDQSNLGSELASIRSNVATAITPSAGSSQEDPGGHPTNKDSLFWGLGIAAKQLAGDVQGAVAYTGGMVTDSLRTGAQLTQAIGSSMGPMPEDGAWGNIKRQAGRLFGANYASGSMSAQQIESQDNAYFGRLFSGGSGKMFAADTAKGVLDVLPWLGTGFNPIGWAMASGINKATDALIGPGLDRLTHITQLQKMGYSAHEAEGAMEGGFWAGIGQGLNKNLNPFHDKKTYLAEAWSEGINVNGENYTGIRAAAALLDQDQLDKSVAALQGGMLAMNELMTRTGMGMGSASQLVNSFAPTGAFNDSAQLTALQAMSALGGKTFDGRNTKHANAWMGSIVQAAQEGFQTYGANFSSQRAFNTAQIASSTSALTMGSLAGAYNADMAVANFNQTFGGMDRSGEGSYAMDRAALANVVGAGSALSQSEALTRGGKRDWIAFEYERNKLASDPVEAAMALLNTPEFASKSVEELAFDLGVNTDAGRAAVRQAKNIHHNRKAAESGGLFTREIDLRSELKAQNLYDANEEYTDWGEFILTAGWGGRHIRSSAKPWELHDGTKVSDAVIGPTQQRLRAALSGREGYKDADNNYVSTDRGWFDRLGDNDYTFGQYNEAIGDAYEKGNIFRAINLTSQAILDPFVDLFTRDSLAENLADGDLKAPILQKLITQFDYDITKLSEKELIQMSGNIGKHISSGRGGEDQEKALKALAELINDFTAQSGISSEAKTKIATNFNIGGAASDKYASLMSTIGDAANEMARLYREDELAGNVQ